MKNSNFLIIAFIFTLSTFNTSIANELKNVEIEVEEIIKQCEETAFRNNAD